MGKYKNRCFLTNNIVECVNHLEELGYKSNPGSGIAWALGIITDPTDDSYTLLNGNSVVEMFHKPKEEGLTYCKSVEEFKKLTSELDPDYVEPEPEEQPANTEAVLGEAAPAEPEVVEEKPAPKKKTTRKKTTKTTETND